MKAIVFIGAALLLLIFYFFFFSKSELDNFAFADDVEVVDMSNVNKEQCTLKERSRKIGSIERLLNENRNGWEKSYISFAVEKVLVGKNKELHIAGNVILIVDKERNQPTLVKEFESNIMDKYFDSLCKK